MCMVFEEKKSFQMSSSGRTCRQTCRIAQCTFVVVADRLKQDTKKFRSKCFSYQWGSNITELNRCSYLLQKRKCKENVFSYYRVLIMLVIQILDIFNHNRLFFVSLRWKNKAVINTTWGHKNQNYFIKWGVISFLKYVMNFPITP